MSHEIVQQISIHACFFTVLALLFRLRQITIDTGAMGWLLRAAMASLALAYLQKAMSRIEGNYATEIDIWRELSLLAVICCRVSIKAKLQGL